MYVCVCVVVVLVAVVVVGLLVSGCVPQRVGERVQPMSPL